MTFLLHGPCLSLPGRSLSVAHHLAENGLLAGLLGCGLVPSKLPPGLLSDGARDVSLSCVSGSPGFPLPTYGPLII